MERLEDSRERKIPLYHWAKSRQSWFLALGVFPFPKCRQALGQDQVPSFPLPRRPLSMVGAVGVVVVVRRVGK